MHSDGRRLCLFVPRRIRLSICVCYRGQSGLEQGTEVRSPRCRVLRPRARPPRLLDGFAGNGRRFRRGSWASVRFSAGAVRRRLLRLGETQALRSPVIKDQVGVLRWPACRSPLAYRRDLAFVGLNALQLLSQPPRLHQASAIFFRDILSDVIWPKSGQNVKMSRKNVTKTQVRPHGREVGELCQGWRGDEPRV